MGAEDRGQQNVIQNVVVLGGGSAGLIAALTLKRKLPQLAVRVIRSPEIGVIGVGEGTTAAFPRHFFEYLKVSPAEFYAGTEPTWKLGIRFLWGPRRQFHYPFAKEYTQRWPGLRRNVGFYDDTDTRFVGPVSALMAHDKAFARKTDGTPQFHNHHAFHIENQKLVAYLESVCREARIEIRDANVKRAEVGSANIAGHEEQIIDALVLENGERVTADLYVDASGFRSELLGRTLSEPVISYEASLFCDRAVIGGWPRTDEPIRPYTLAETMEAGWCWQIEHEHWTADSNFQGFFDEFRIYDYALNQAQILGDFNAGPDVLNVVPEPGSAALLSIGAGSFLALRRRRS